MSERLGTPRAPNCQCVFLSRARERQEREARRFCSRRRVQTFKRCGGHRPASACKVGVSGRRRWRRSQRAGAGWLRLLLRLPPPPSRRPPQLPPAGSLVQPRCPGARPWSGSPAHRVVSLRAPAARRRQRRAPTQRWATPCTGPCQVCRGALTGRRALGFSSPQGTRWVTSGEPPHPLGALGAQRAGVSGASWTPAPRAPLGWALRSRRTGTASRLPWGPQSSFSLLGQMREGAAGAMLLAPSPLFQPEGAEEGARGALGRDWSRAPQGFRRPEPPVVPRLQLLIVGALAGVPQFPAASAPAAHAALVWPCSHTHPGCAPLWYPLSWGLLVPRSHHCRAHRPLVNITLEFPGPE